MASKEDLPTEKELMLPVLQAVDRLGGSATRHQVREAIVEKLAPSEDLLAITYEGQGRSIYLDRIGWACSACKHTGVFESPKRGLYLVTGLGRKVLAMKTADAVECLAEFDREVRRAGRERSADAEQQPGGDATSVVAVLSGDDAEEVPLLADEESEEWKKALLERLHRMSPEGFERFVLYLLRNYDLELRHVGQSGDRGIDGIGTAPMSPVLSATVAVQVKRYDPTKRIGRDIVALFQRDADAAGAERAILVTLGGYTAAAREASQVTTPTVDLIDGDRLCDLALDKQVGVRNIPQVDPTWFDRFDPQTPTTPDGKARPDR